MPDAPDDTSDLAFDLDPRETYAAVGYAVSRWEELELRLAQLYSIFVGEPMIVGAILACGREARTQHKRLKLLRKAGRGFFLKNYNQGREREFDRLAERVELLSRARNRIAHGIVSPVPFFCPLDAKMKRFGTPKIGCRLVPPLYAMMSLVRQDEELYAYKGSEIRQMSRQFMDCANEAGELLTNLDASAQARPARDVPPS